MGDLHHQLHQPKPALAVYQHALEQQGSPSYELTARLIYTHLRLNQPTQAYQEAIEQVRRTDAEPRSLALVRYVTEQGVSADALADELQRIYKKEDQSAALALAVADLLPAERGQALLTRHLADHPTDERVFEGLLDRLMPEGAAKASLDQRAEALAATVRIMAASPEHAQQQARTLVETAGGALSLLEAFDKLPRAQRNKPMTQVLHGLVLLAADRPDEAEAPLREALTASPNLRVARLMLARLAINDQDFEQARAA